MVADFECVPTGRAALLRVTLSERRALRDPVLLIGHGSAVTLVDALPAPLNDGALGFACPREALDGDPTYRLHAGGVTVLLSRPATRGPAGWSA